MVVTLCKVVTTTQGKPILLLIAEERFRLGTLNANDELGGESPSQTIHAAPRVECTSDLLPEVWVFDRNDASPETAPETPPTPANDHPSRETTSAIRIERAVAAILADHERLEGKLERSQFERMVLRRKLEAEEIVEVIRRLRIHGIDHVVLGLEEVEQPRNTEPVADAADATAAPLVSGYGKASLLTHAEHVRFSRAVQIGLLAKRDIDSGISNDDLIALVEQGEKAKARMVTANIRLVFSMARKMRHGDLEFSDHVQNGILGLMRAVEMFDPDLGLQFSTYAHWWIRQGMWRGLDNEGGLIRIPVHQINNLRRMRRMQRRLTVEYGREPDLAELAEALEWTKEQTRFLQRLSMFRTSSIEAPLDEDDEFHIGDTLACDLPSPEQTVEESSRDRLLRSLMSQLSDRERLILERRFGFVSGAEETLQEIGDDYGVTRERIRQIEEKAVKKLYKKALRHMNALID
ncbi:sigma-70 family RNA polymerase sigma factor [Pseudorhodoplanes sp.]|uniref:sigma-70 family RNA polymerase sigma factor n=1 Tax=Pseudorhodoplanes sp. TaxID=1934341 RepID=UPI003D0D9F85